MDQLEQAYSTHIEQLQQRTLQALQRVEADALLIAAGEPLGQFLDDQSYPFKVNPHFKAWLPVVNNPHCWLLVDGRQRPKLLFYSPEDFWHKPAELPGEAWVRHFDITLAATPEAIHQWLPPQRDGLVLLAEQQYWAQQLSIAACNPPPLLDFLHYHRARKTTYEQQCLRLANRRAMAGHLAAREAFRQGCGELAIHLAYLAASGQAEHELPYANIVAQNEHAAILHYTQLARTAPQGKLHSLLIDAGAQYNGYAADITRTYAMADGPFGHLIDALDEMQQQLIMTIRPGMSFVDLHLAAHRLLAEVLIGHQLVKGSVESIVAQGISRVFFPHGLGHQLGLQVHDVGGLLLDDHGSRRTAPDADPFLRCTRTLEAGQVVTIEPGVYFIDSLLGRLRQQPAGRQVNWPLVEQLHCCGGIRIEDNILVHPDRVENFTREQEVVLQS